MCTWLFKSSPWFNSIQFNFISTSTEMQGIYSNHKTHKSNNNRWLRDDNRRKLLKACGCASKHIPRFPKHIPWFVFKANENTIFENLKLVHTLCIWEIRAGLHVPLTMPMYCLGERWIRLSSPVHNACVFLRRVQTGIRHPFIILIRENQIWPSSAIYNVVALLSFSVTLGGTIRKFVFQVDFSVW